MDSVEEDAKFRMLMYTNMVTLMATWLSGNHAFSVLPGLSMKAQGLFINPS